MRVGKERDDLLGGAVARIDNAYPAGRPVERMRSEPVRGRRVGVGGRELRSASTTHVNVHAEAAWLIEP